MESILKPHDAITVADQNGEPALVYEWFRRQTWPEAAYLALAEASNHPIEFSNGRLVILPMPTLKHQRILKRFTDHVTAWLADHPIAELIYAPHPIRLWPGKYREPDAMIWLDEHRDRLGDTASGPPDLALEVHSPTSTPLDRETKFEEYALAGIPEYWMVNPQTERVSVFALEGQSYRLIGHFGRGEHAASRVLSGFEVAADALFDEA